MLPRKPGHQKRAQVEMVALPSGHKVPAYTLKQSEPQPGPRGVFERLPAVSGSIAGANSRFLDEYKKHRDKEMRRLASMESREELEKDRMELEKRKEERQRTLEEEAVKKRERRQKRKLGKSTDGLNLPVDVVNHIKGMEEADHIPPDPKRMHPYAMNTWISSEKKISSSITIVDEDD